MKRIFQAATWTPTATADAATLANGTYMSIGNAAAANMLSICEVEENGQASASAVNIMQFARESTLPATPTALASPNSDGPLTGVAQALSASPICAVAATTGPQRSNATTGAKLNLAFNAYGGIVRWTAVPGFEIKVIGVTASVSNMNLSAFTGGSPGLMGSHIIYELE